MCLSRWNFRRDIVLPLILIILLSSLPKLSQTRAQEEPDELVGLAHLFSFVLKGIRELPRGSSLKNPGEIAWIGGLLYYVPTPGAPMEPTLNINLYAAAILEFSIENKDLLNLPDKDVALAKEKIASICSHFLFSTARSRSPPGGWVDFSRGDAMSTEVTTDVIKVIIKAQTLGIIPNSGPEHQELAKAVGALLSSQNPNGGWGKYPQSIEDVEKMSDPYFTAITLEALLITKKAGFSVDAAIKRAISFLQSSAKKYQSKAHWSTVLTTQKDIYGESFVTARVLEALIAAHMKGYNVDIELLKQASRYESEYLNLNTALGFREASFSIRSLCYSSALGLIDTTDVVKRGGYFVSQLKESQTEEGYWSLHPQGVPHFLWDDLSYSYHASQLLIEWFWITSLGIDLDYEGPLTEGYEPPRFVENDTMKVRLTLSNLVSGITLNLEVRVDLPLGCHILEEKGNQMTLAPGQSAVYEATIKAPQKVQGLTPATISFIILKDSGEPIRSRLLELELARNANLEIISKEVDRNEIYLGEEAVITVKFKNTGEVPASTVAIAEELGDGFQVLTEGSPNASVASMIAVGEGFPIARIEPGVTVTYGFKVKANSPPGGNVLASITKITYLDPLGNVRELEKEVNITVMRPDIVVQLNVSDFTIKWHQQKPISIEITNKGNSLGKDVSLQLRADKELSIKVISVPEGAEVSYERESNRQRISLDKIEPNETAKVIINVETSWFYTSISKLTSLLVSVEYKDDRNKFFDDYKDTEALQITLLISNLAKGIFFLIFALVLTIILIRIRASLASRPKRRFKRSRRFG